MKINYECHNEECLHDFEIDYTPPTPHRNMNGRMEDAIQGDDAEFDIWECPECGTEIDIEYIIENN